MPTYIVLGQFTDQGVRAVKDTTKRANAFKETAKTLGASVKSLYWTIGRYDIASVVEAPDDETAATLLFGLGRLGNVRTQTLRAFEADEVDRMLAKL
jgi:uncharacterized protein with GYD domain